MTKTPKRPRGRPTRGDDGRATHRISISLTDQELAQFQRLARLNRCTLADVVRVSVANTSRDGQDDPVPLVLGDGRVLVFHR